MNHYYKYKALDGKTRQEVVDILNKVAAIGEEAVLREQRRRIINLIHQRELGLDQHRGNLNDPDTQWRPEEATTATMVELQTGWRLRRARRDEAGDWKVDSSGKTLDAVGPVPPQHLDVNSFNNQITKHLRKYGVDEIPVVLTGLYESQILEIMRFIEQLDVESQVRLRVFC